MEQDVGKCKHLTDAFTKLLMPGESTREMSAWVINNDTLL
jgi:hypothetical protein